MMRILPVGVCIIFIFVPILTSTHIQEINNEGGSVITNYHLGKRVQRGASAIIALLRNAKLVAGAKNYRLYWKSGGAKQAEKDFRSLDPIITFKDRNSKWGLVDDKAVEIITDTLPELNIQSIRRKPDGLSSTSTVFRRIVYDD